MKHLRLFLIVATCLGLTVLTVSLAFAQEGGAVRGKITDTTADQNPIEGVLVTITGVDAKFTTKTDAEGDFLYEGLPAGRYLIGISKDGYEERRGKPVMITNGGTAFVSLKMTPKDGIGKFFKDMLSEAQPSRVKMPDLLRQQIAVLLQRVAESVGARYELNTPFYPPAVLDAIVEHLQKEKDLDVYARAAEEGNHTALLELLLSHPEGKAAFAEYLSETQLQDYVAYTAKRRLREQEAVAHAITASLDADLSLSAAQRQKVKQLLLDAAGNTNFPRAMEMLTINADEVLPLVHHKLRVSMEDVLSEAQSEVWHGLLQLINQRQVSFRIEPIDSNEPIDFREGMKELVDEKGRHRFVPKDAATPDGMEEFNPAEPKERMKRLAAAKLAAHTERLGPLDETATQFLEIAMKGALQQFDETQGEPASRLSTEVAETDNDTVEILKGIMRQRTAELLKLKEMALRITEHPLYQETIKEVLSEEAFARYQAYQTEQMAFLREVFGRMIVACIDTQLLLDDTQRQQLEAEVDKFDPFAGGEAEAADSHPFGMLRSETYLRTLTAWQQTELERFFGELLSPGP